MYAGYQLKKEVRVRRLAGDPTIGASMPGAIFASHTNARATRRFTLENVGERRDVLLVCIRAFRESGGGCRGCLWTLVGRCW